MQDVFEFSAARHRLTRVPAAILDAKQSTEDS